MDLSRAAVNPSLEAACEPSLVRTPLTKSIRPGVLAGVDVAATFPHLRSDRVVAAAGFPLMAHWPSRSDQGVLSCPCLRKTACS